MVKSLGLVFGDIGTSPIYTFTVVFILGLEPTPANVVGVLSLIIWTLILLVTVQYVWLAMSLGRKGEGGTIVLKEILVRLLDNRRLAYIVSLLSFVGVSLLVGDGVITPAISILSAVEGLRLVPGLGTVETSNLVALAALIAILLFSFQRKGTDRVSYAFGPIMLVWFLSLGVIGAVSIASFPGVLAAFNPLHGINLILSQGLSGKISAFAILSQVILCATGGEALYADMGHLGKRPIVRGWYFVFTALVLNYMGQGAFLVTHPDARNIFFEMAYSVFSFLYVPFLLLSVAATVIASQAMISGMFSIVYQGITTRMLPMFKVDYTSSRHRAQIYISHVNWGLLLAVLFIMFEFKESGRLANAYGLAVTGTMTITAVMMTLIFFLKRRMMRVLVSIFVGSLSLLFLVSCLGKIPEGGYWSLVLASIPLSLIILYTEGQKRLYEALRPVSVASFVAKYKAARREGGRIRGTAVFFARDTRKIPSYIASVMFVNNIIYENNIIVTLPASDEPFGVEASFHELAPGLKIFEVKAGYMQVIDLEKIMAAAGIDEDVIFYGIEDISTHNPFWVLFSLIKKVMPAFVQFYSLPPEKLHGVVMRVEM